MKNPISIYALVKPNGDVAKVSDSLNDVTNYLTKEIEPPEFWNSIFGGSMEHRVETFKKYGWHVMEGHFVKTNFL